MHIGSGEEDRSVSLNLNASPTDTPDSRAVMFRAICDMHSDTHSCLPEWESSTDPLETDMGRCEIVNMTSLRMQVLYDDVGLG